MKIFPYWNAYVRCRCQIRRAICVCPLWLCHLATFVYLLMHLFAKLNIQLEWFLSPIVLCRFNMLNQPKSHLRGLTSADGSEHIAKLGWQTLNEGQTPADGLLSAWCVKGFRHHNHPQNLTITPPYFNNYQWLMTLCPFVLWIENSLTSKVCVCAVQGSRSPAGALTFLCWLCRENNRSGSRFWKPRPLFVGVFVLRFS